MKLLDRYLFGQFTRNLLMVLCSLISIYLMVDFFERVDNFLQSKLGITEAIRYLVLKLPQIYEQLIPACILLAGVITLGVLNRHFEFMALMAAGLSVRRIIRPLLTAALLFTLLTMAAGEWLLPATIAETNRIWHREVNQEIPRGIIRDGRTYFRGDSGIFSFVQPNPEQNIFFNFTLTTIDQQGLARLLSAETARFENGTWILSQGQIKERNESGGFTVRIFNEHLPALSEGPELFFLPTYKIQEYPYSLLFKKATGPAPDQTARMEFHRRLSYCLLGIPLLLIGIPTLLSVYKTRGRDLALAIPVSCGLAFSAWGAWSFTQSLARSAVLPPAIASWSVHLAVGAIGLLLIYRHDSLSRGA